MSKPRKSIYLIMIMVLLCLTCSVFAQEETAAVRVGYYENEVFEEGASENAEKSGYAFDYYEKISEYTGWEYEYVYGNFSDLYRMLLDGEIDLLAGLAWRDDRDGLIGYPDEPMGNEAYILVKNSSAADITDDPQTLIDSNIGVLESAVFSQLIHFLEENNIKADVVTYQDYEILFADFDSKRLDVLAGEGDGTHLREDTDLLYAFGASDYFLCVSRDRPDLLDTLNDAQTQMFTDDPDFIHELQEKYYPIRYGVED